jgi:hypothetical protein
VELNPADLAVLQALPTAANGQTPTNAEGAADKPVAPQWPWHLQASDDLLPGSVRASASDAVVSDLIENRLEVLARGLLLDSNGGMANSAFQPSRMAARMANDREVVDAQPRMTPAPAPTRSFGTPVMDEAQDIDEASSFAPASLAERDLADMDLPDLNLGDLDAQPDWNAAALGDDVDAGPDNFLPPDADTSDV